MNEQGEVKSWKDERGYKYLSELKHEYSDKPVNEWQKIEFNGSLFFYEPSANRSGFCVAAVEWAGTDEGGDLYERVFEAWAAFDGVRHIWFGEQGYINYPHIERTAQMLLKVRELEKEFCNASEINPDEETK